MHFVFRISITFLRIKKNVKVSEINITTKGFENKKMNKNYKSNFEENM